MDVYIYIFSKNLLDILSSWLILWTFLFLWGFSFNLYAIYSSSCTLLKRLILLSHTLYSFKYTCLHPVSILTVVNCGFLIWLLRIIFFLQSPERETSCLHPLLNARRTWPFLVSFCPHACPPRPALLPRGVSSGVLPLNWHFRHFVSP